jgi:hypothetical protein
MKDNIESKHIGNRKFIIELRFSHKVIIADKKGTIVDAIQKIDLFPQNHWEMGVANISIFDATDKIDSQNVISIELNRLSYISTKIDSVDRFYNNFMKVYECIINQIGSLSIRRIGCRIQGTYYSQSKSFEPVLNNFKDSFPNQIFLDNYIPKDLMLQVNYQNGMYKVGPANNIGDQFIQENFDNKTKIEHVGIAIDTDNFLTNEKHSIDDMSLIKDVYMMSLSVEKDLFNKLNKF